jgi:adenylate kinase
VQATKNKSNKQKQKEEKDMQQVAENYHVKETFKRIAPSYTSKFTLYCTVDGHLVLLIGNQYLQVTPQEVRDILEHTIKQAALFTGNGVSHE